MTQGFYQLKVVKKVQETADASSIYLEIPEQLKETFTYKPGQYLNFNVNIGGEEVRRAYSLCTSPYTDAIPAVTVKKVEHGKMSSYMNDVLKEGDVLEVMPPNGKFTIDINPALSRHVVLFGGGSGITPLMAIAKSVLNRESGSRITLIYANRNLDSVIFRSAIEAMEKEFAGRFTVHHSLDEAPMGWFGLKGYLTEEKIDHILKERIGGMWTGAEYYICGPSTMMDIVKKGLASAGVPQSNIHTEYFAAPVTPSHQATTVAVESPFSGKAHVKVNVYGKHHEIDIDENTTILDAAINAGLEPPFSCTVGVCTTCRAKVHKGKVFMREREGLTDDEVEQGYVLTCQSLPRSSEIELTFE